MAGHTYPMKARLLLLILLLPLLALGQTRERPDYRRKASTLTLTRIVDRMALILSDGSAWEVRNEDRSKSNAWQAGKKIAVYWTKHREWPYRLVFDPGSAEAKMVSAQYMKRL